MLGIIVFQVRLYQEEQVTLQGICLRMSPLEIDYHIYNYIYPPPR